MLGMIGIRNGIFAACCVIAALCVTPVSAGTNPLAADARLHVITDPHSGLALFGYDPVAYHVEQAARMGLPEHQLTLDGRIWRFRSEANRAAFEADPSAYIPLFGGHDGAKVSDGILTKGNPETFVIAGGQLVLFRDEHSRDRFAGDGMIRQKAQRDWPNVVRQQAAH